MNYVFMSTAISNYASQGRAGFGVVIAPRLQLRLHDIYSSRLPTLLVASCALQNTGASSFLAVK